MSGKSRTDAILSHVLEQRVPLAVAAHYVRAQLADDPRALYDPQHFIDMLDIAGGVVSVAPVYTQDAGCAKPRRLTQSELEDAKVTRAATLLVLRDGRTLSNVFVKRCDLRQAIATLKAAGVPELQALASRRKAPAPQMP